MLGVLCHGFKACLHIKKFKSAALLLEHFQNQFFVQTFFVIDVIALPLSTGLTEGMTTISTLQTILSPALVAWIIREAQWTLSTKQLTIKISQVWGFRAQNKKNITVTLADTPSRSAASQINFVSYELGAISHFTRMAVPLRCPRH